MYVNLGCESDNIGNLLFTFNFKNDTDEDKIIPVSEFNNSVDNIGLKIIANGEMLEPVRYVMITLSDPRKGDVILKPKQNYELFIKATIEETKALGYVLKFKNATYLIERGISYKFFYSWRDFKSNEIEWTFK